VFLARTYTGKNSLLYNYLQNSRKLKSAQNWLILLLTHPAAFNGAHRYLPWQFKENLLRSTILQNF